MRVVGFEASHGDAVLTFACAATRDATGTYNAVLGWKVDPDNWARYVEEGNVTACEPSPEVPEGPCEHPYMVMRARTSSVPSAVLHAALCSSGRPSWREGPWTYWLFRSLEELHSLTAHAARPLLEWSRTPGLDPVQADEARSAAFVLDHRLVLPEILGERE